MTGKLLLSILLTTGGPGVPRTPEPVRFPGTADALRSPDGRFELQNVDHDAATTADAPHVLFIADRTSGSKRLVQSYLRSVTARWSADSRRFFVNDAFASDETDCFVYFPSDAARRLSIGDLLRRDRRTAGPLSNHHVYVEGREFGNGDRLTVEVRGHGEQAPRGFRDCYSVSLETLRVRRVRCPPH